MNHVLIGLLALPLLATAACTDSTTIVASDYDQSCAFDSDCVTIVGGDVCACGLHCAAINVVDRARYEDDLQALGGCGVSVGPACGDDDPFIGCRSRFSVCLSGRCEVE